jgi:L-aspartate oxidase
VPTVMRANQTVLATGGIGQLYLRTTNPRNACGDGLAMALAAGAKCKTLEFVQFHPTALAVPADPLPLLTEALRGAGARLVDEAGTEFMREAHPLADLAPRDVVAREVWKRTESGVHVYLDAREVLERDAQAFPSVRNQCLMNHLDPQRDLLPVTAAAHYHMGGVAVDLDGRTSLERLWACGEVACTGAHGANRLASNSLLEAVVFGRRVGRALSSEQPQALPPPSPSLPEGAGYSMEVDAQAFNQLREILWRDVGIVREASGLERALEQLGRIAAAVPARQILLQGRVRVAQAIALAALANSHSVGAHYRADESVADCHRAAG